MSLYSIFHNEYLGVALLAWLVAQILKIILSFYTTRKINMHLIMSSGGMPSSHSSITTSLATMIGIYEGFHTSIFALSFIFSAVVMYDAAGVRRAAGQHATILNLLVQKSKEEWEHNLDIVLKELLGHTPLQVFAGGVLGIIISYSYYLLLHH